MIWGGPLFWETSVFMDWSEKMLVWGSKGEPYTGVEVTQKKHLWWLGIDENNGEWWLTLNDDYCHGWWSYHGWFGGFNRYHATILSITWTSIVVDTWGNLARLQHQAGTAAEDWLWRIRNHGIKSVQKKPCNQKYQSIQARNKSSNCRNEKSWTASGTSMTTCNSHHPTATSSHPAPQRCHRWQWGSRLTQWSCYYSPRCESMGGDHQGTQSNSCGH